MLERFLVLKPALISAIASTSDIAVEFSNGDWKLMWQIEETLKTFKKATLQLSKASASISQVIPLVTYIIRKLKVDKEHDHGIKTFKRQLQTAMEDRFASLEDHEHFYVATLLDPRYKGYFFLKSHTLERAKFFVSTKLKERIESELVVTEEMDQTDHGQSEIDKEMSQMVQASMAQHSSENEVNGFLEDYCKSNIIKNNNPLDFWKSKSSSMKMIDRLASNLAAHYLTPPATSVDVERLFSTAGDILTPERDRLCPETAEKVLFLRENLPIVGFQY